MEIEKFIEKRPFLYHLTNANNIPNILAEKRLYSTNTIISMTKDSSLKEKFRHKRNEHEVVNVGKADFYIRDQKPIIIKVLARSTTHNWTPSDFIEHLNGRVFFWPNLDRLGRHFNTYIDEKPIILRVASAEMLQINSNAEFCRLNSGATRCNSYLGGNAPERGPETFLPASKYGLSIGSVAEVTFPGSCELPARLWKANHPNGPWKEIK